MGPEDLARELCAKGLVVLGVVRSEPGVLVVYLHGAAGQWVDGLARSMIRAVPGVAWALTSEQSEAIVLVGLRNGPGR